MSAEIILFVPRPNPKRPTLLEEAERKGVEFLERAPALLTPATMFDFSDYEPRKPA